MNPDDTSAPAPAPVETREIILVLIPVAIATVLADFLFWKSGVGISIGIYFAYLAVLLFALVRNRPNSRLLAVFAALAACCVQSAIEISLSNVLASIVLTLALVGEAFQPHLAGIWARFSEAIFGFVSVPFRWFSIAIVATRGARKWCMPNVHFLARCARLVWVIAPAVILLFAFAGIFMSGNAIFAELVARIGRHAFEWVAQLNLSPVRFIFWAFTATIALGIFHGVRAPDAPRWWTFTLPRIPRPDHRLAAMQSGAVLIALNALFCLVNTIDAAYLWRSGKMPAGVNHTEFVHEGVWSLITAVVLSAIIIAGMFQQEDRVVAGRGMKSLAHLWVVQNFVLIGGVLLRLKLYVDASQLTEKRVYVACFLVLVTTGFLFLAWFVEKRRTFNWLLGRNAAATFLLFSILQFPDVASSVARYNVTRFISSQQSRESQGLDIEYLASLGPGAWTPLKVVAENPRPSLIRTTAREKLQEIRQQETYSAANEDWREWQWRRRQARLTLLFRP